MHFNANSVKREPRVLWIINLGTRLKLRRLRNIWVVYGTMAPLCMLYFFSSNPFAHRDTHTQLYTNWGGWPRPLKRRPLQQQVAILAVNYTHTKWNKKGKKHAHIDTDSNKRAGLGIVKSLPCRLGFYILINLNWLVCVCVCLYIDNAVGFKM